MNGDHEMIFFSTHVLRSICFTTFNTKTVPPMTAVFIDPKLYVEIKLSQRRFIVMFMAIFVQRGCVFKH